MVAWQPSVMGLAAQWPLAPSRQKGSPLQRPFPQWHSSPPAQVSLQSSAVQLTVHAAPLPPPSW